MTILQAILIAIVEGLTEFLPVSSTAHMVFLSGFFHIANDEFVKMFEVSIQFGAILAVVVLYWKKFFDFSKLNFYFKLAFAVMPALLLGFFLDDYIESVLEKPLPIAIVRLCQAVFLDIACQTLSPCDFTWFTALCEGVALLDCPKPRFCRRLVS